MGSMSVICNALGIDRVDMNQKLTLIEEQHGTNANFVINSVLSNALKKNYGICLVLYHNTFGHYHNVGMRFGYNLSALKDKGQVVVVEPMQIIASEVNDVCKNIKSPADLILPKTTISSKNEIHECIVYKLFSFVKDAYQKAEEYNNSVVIIIEDLSHLFDLGLNIKDSLHYVRYLRSFVELQPLSQLCIALHTYQCDPQHSNIDLIANGLKYMADLIVITEPLKTGNSSDVSGKMTVSWKVISIRTKFHWPESSTYLYKLFDWQIKIFAPGVASSLS